MRRVQKIITLKEALYANCMQMLKTEKGFNLLKPFVVAAPPSRLERETL